MRFETFLILLASMLTIVSSGTLLPNMNTPGYVILDLGSPNNQGGCVRGGSGGPCDIDFGQNTNTASASVSPTYSSWGYPSQSPSGSPSATLPHSDFSLWVYAGASSYTTSLLVRAHGFSVTLNSLVIQNSTSLNPSGSTVWLQVDRSFQANSITIGTNGYLTADPSVAQNGIFVTTNFFYMQSNSVVSGSQFDVVVNVLTNFGQGSSFSVSKGLFYGNLEFVSTTSTAVVGFEFSCTGFIDGASNITAPHIWVKQAYNVPNSTDTIHCTSNSNNFRTNNGDFSLNSPAIISNCNVDTGNFIIYPPIDYEASFGNTTNRKRDGSTQSSTYNGGTTFANSIVQAARYVASTLFKRRDVASKKRYVAQDNTFKIINGHYVYLRSMDQADAAQFLVSCDSRMIWLGVNQTMVSKQCQDGVGCPQNSSCSTGGNIVAVPNWKRGADRADLDL